MLNLIKMDLCHMGKMKSGKILLLLIMLLPGILGTILVLTGSTERVAMNYFEQAFPQIAAGDALIMLTIFAALFSHHDLKSGYIKSIANQIGSKGKLAIAKTISLSVYTIIFFVAAHIGTLIYCLICGSGITFTGFGEYIPFILVQLLLQIAFCSLISFVTILLNNTAVSLVLGLVVSTGFVAMIYSVIDMAVNKMFSLTDFTLAKYTLSGNITHVVPGGEVTTPIIVGVIFLALSIFGAYTVLNKRDVK